MSGPVCRRRAMRLGKRPASLRISLNSPPLVDSDSDSGLSTSQESPNVFLSHRPNIPHTRPTAESYLSHAKRVKTALAPRLSNFQTTGCLSPTDSPQLLDKSLRLAAETEGGNEEKEKEEAAASQIGHFILLSPLDSAGVSYHALDTRTRQINTCHVLTDARRDHLYKISERLNSCQFRDWPHGDLKEMSELVVPAGTELVRKDGINYLFSPGNFGSLHSYVQSQKRVDEETGREVYGQIVRLVAFCHSIGIVVRDLKLRKFVFLDRERTKLRLSSINDLVVLENWAEDGLSDRHGCPAYVSPEILNLQQKSYSGKAADVWSLGVLLFVMLLGRYPFYDSTPAGLFGKIRQGFFSIPSELGLSLEVRYLLRGLLRREPKERPTAAELMSIPWFQRKAKETSSSGATSSMPTVQTSSGGSRSGPSGPYTASTGQTTVLSRESTNVQRPSVILRGRGRPQDLCDDHVVPSAPLPVNRG